MAKTIKGKPDGYHSITPYLILEDAAKALAFYAQVFDAKEKFRMERPDGKIGHAEIQIGDSVIMLCDEYEEMEARSPRTYGGSPVMLCLYVDDVDAMVKRAVDAGAKMKMPVKNQFYGDRAGTVIDPFGYLWHIATHVEDVPPEEINRRYAEMLKQTS